MAGPLDVVVKFVGDSSNLEKSVGNLEKRSHSLANGFKAIAAGLAGVFAVHEIGNFVGAAEEAQVATKRLQKTLENAGDASGEWAKHAEKLADSLQKSTGIDDELIKGGQAILATFHQVGGAVGQTSGIFDRATKAALDMSKAGFGDVDSAAKQLGKALEDPIKGITALNKSGITFTADQKKLIKSLVESGDKAGAMGVIMDNVEGQVGGVADATATASDKMSVAWDETQEALGKLLLPVLERVAPVISDIATAVQETIIPAVGDFARGVGERLQPAIETSVAWLQDRFLPALADFAGSVADRLGPAIDTAVGWLEDHFLPALGDIGDWLVDHVDDFKSWLEPFATAAEKVLPWLRRLAEAFFVTAVIVAKWLQPKIENLLTFLNDHRETVYLFAGAVTATLIPALYGWAVAAGAAALATLALLAPILAFVAVVGLVIAAIVIAGELLGGWGDTFEWLLGVIQNVWTWIRDNWPLLLEILLFPFAQAAMLIKDHWRGILSFFGNVAAWLLDAFVKVQIILQAPFLLAVWFIMGAWGQVRTFFENLPGWVATAFSTLGSILAGPFVWAWTIIKAIAGWIIDRVENIVSAVDRLKSILSGGLTIGLGPLSGIGDIGSLIPGHAAGGLVTTPHLAMVGENGPELITPLDRLGALGAPVTINVYTTGLGADAPEIQRQVAQALRGYQRTNGTYRTGLG
jgi:hypothetical protein